MKNLFNTLAISTLLLSSSLVHGQQARFKDHLRVDDQSPNLPIYYKYSENDSTTITIKLSYDNFYTKSFLKNEEMALSFSDSDRTTVSQGNGGVYRKANYKWKGDTLFLDFYPYWNKNDSTDLKSPIGVTDIERQYPKGGTYFIKIPNRTSLKVSTRAVAVGALTVPFRLHFNGRNSDSDYLFTKDLNVGFYVGLERGYKSFYNSKYTGKESSTTLVFSFFSLLSGQSLKPGNTSDRYPEGKETFEAFYSPGLMTTLAFGDIQLIAAFGVDLPLSNNASQWDFSRRPWVGFGAGYSIFKR
ncbi:MAG: hypothetical protein JJ978_03400 [Roseivirga sp.]|uniref:hypothetical protein n=1 Tax=Roseivirga sp. TaxID=1964215 RepID=UPI001B227D88|nr:hypothetical protein [Roseivirga sp.]MBO6494588.1 hypothetical protein [Roseivirga sp.]